MHRKTSKCGGMNTELWNKQQPVNFYHVEAALKYITAILPPSTSEINGQKRRQGSNHNNLTPFSNFHPCSVWIKIIQHSNIQRAGPSVQGEGATSHVKDLTAVFTS